MTRCITLSSSESKSECIGDEKRTIEKTGTMQKAFNRVLRSGVKPLAVVTLPLLTRFSIRDELYALLS
jgi:hypothetical protein